MKILVINAGSSSLKYQLIDMDTREVISKGLAERIGMELGRLTHRYGEGCAEKYVVDVKFDDHTAAIQMVLDEESGIARPAVNEALCIGCGACENLCPARPFSAITVNGRHNHLNEE